MKTKFRMQTAVALGALSFLLGCVDRGTANSRGTVHSNGRTAHASAAVSTGPDMVLVWNAIAAQTIVGPGGAGKVPPLGLVDLAIVHTAVYDAVNAISGSPHKQYAVQPSVNSPASPDAATAAAAHDVLVALYPSKASALNAQYATSLATIADGDAKTNGISVGQQTAAGILALRANDGRNAGTTITLPAPGPGVYVPTPPGFLPPQAPWAQNITPWLMSSPSQFHSPPPPSLDSDLWVNDYNDVKSLGAAVGSSRTPEQTDIGKFWGDQPMLQWNRAWRGISISRGLSLQRNARFFAMLSTAGSDSLIGCWESKYTYFFWRPVTAIRAGGANPALTADPSWISQVVTPNHPEYPAAHGCLSGAVTHTLASFFGVEFGSDDDEATFSFTIDAKVPGLLQPVRSYTSLSQALDEVLRARRYGGMHYRNSTLKGAELGKQVARLSKRRFACSDDGEDDRVCPDGDDDHGSGDMDDRANRDQDDDGSDDI
jgi:hypothetical protein